VSSCLVHRLSSLALLAPRGFEGVTSIFHTCVTTNNSSHPRGSTLLSEASLSFLVGIDVTLVFDKHGDNQPILARRRAPLCEVPAATVNTERWHLLRYCALGGCLPFAEEVVKGESGSLSGSGCRRRPVLLRHIWASRGLCGWPESMDSASNGMSVV
jgi:hypothetical protein